MSPPEGAIATFEDLAAALSGEPMAAERGGYTVTMREDAGAAAVLQRLERLGPASGEGWRFHLGWGSFRNLDIVAARRSGGALICDVNRHQLALWHAVRESVLRSDSARSFACTLPRLLPDGPPLRQFATSTEDWLTADLERRESWLYESEPSRYAHIRSLFAAKAVGFCCLDLRASSVFPPLATELRAIPGLALDTAYVSNIPYMLRQPYGFYGEANDVDAYRRMWRNLAVVCAPETLLIIAERLAAHSSPDDLQWQTDLVRGGVRSPAAAVAAGHVARLRATTRR